MNLQSAIIITVVFLSLFAAILYYTVRPEEEVLVDDYLTQYVLDVGEHNSWQAEVVTSPSVLFDDSRRVYRMWYVGNGVLDRSGIGYVESNNGYDWELVEHTDPVFSAAGDWAAGGIRSAHVLLVRGTYHMWYSAEEWKGEERRRIGHATSRNGKNWQDDQSVVLEGTAGTWYEHSVDDPTVAYFGGSYHMWFTGRSEKKGVSAVGYATSRNGTEWEVQGNLAVLTSDGSDWTEEGISDPHVLSYNGGEVLEMWFTGTDKRENTRLGRAVSQDGLTWVIDEESPLVADEEMQFKEPFVTTTADRKWYYIWMERDPGQRKFIELHATVWPKQFDDTTYSRYRHDGEIQVLPDEIPGYTRSAY